MSLQIAEAASKIPAHFVAFLRQGSKIIGNAAAPTKASESRQPISAQTAGTIDRVWSTFLKTSG